MSTTIQYIIIFALFIFALYVIFKPFFSKKSGTPGCGKGCNCDVEIKPKK
ncbi:Virus attachment protein p12 family protein [Sphingobacterium lactis]|uniref:Virus attachment protein p12 family protein n=1 Tax=Sphingobacterium lactis TaxID=797291 RepID=A0A1H6BXI9_9SPHI|nr:Virus attachment protein p12 family protein [Sphingobacterium lactis]